MVLNPKIIQTHCIDITFSLITSVYLHPIHTALFSLCQSVIEMDFIRIV